MKKNQLIKTTHPTVAYDDYGLPAFGPPLRAPVPRGPPRHPPRSHQGPAQHVVGLYLSNTNNFLAFADWARQLPDEARALLDVDGRTSSPSPIPHRQ